MLDGGDHGDTSHQDNRYSVKYGINNTSIKIGDQLNIKTAEDPHNIETTWNHDQQNIKTVDDQQNIRWLRANTIQNQQ